MTPAEAAQHILKEMAAGRRFVKEGGTGGGEGVRDAAAMAKFSGGRDYVHVDTDQHLFDGKPEKEFPKIAHRVILDKFRGKVIGDAPQNAYVKTESAGEFAYPGKPLDEVADAAKMRFAPELDNLLRAGKFIAHKADDGSHPDAVGGWDYYETVFEVGGKLFRGKVNVLNNKRGRVFHDVTDIKEDTRGLMDQYGKPQAQFPDVSTSGSIAQPAVEGKGGGDSTTREARRLSLPPSGKDIRDYLNDKDGFWRNLRRALQDKNIGLRDIEEKLGVTEKEDSAYYAKDRAYGKNEHELTYLQKQEVDPIIEKIHKSGGRLGLFSAFLYAEHSGERNAALKASKGVTDGSGMNAAQAKPIYDAVDRLGLRSAFEDAAKDVYAMNQKYLKRRVDSGRMTQGEYDFLTNRYKKYVPLRSDMTNEELAFSIVQNEQAICASNANEGCRGPVPFALQLTASGGGRQSSTIQADCQPLSGRRAEDVGSHERHFAEPT